MNYQKHLNTSLLSNFVKFTFFLLLSDFMMNERKLELGETAQTEFQSAMVSQQSAIL